MAEYRVESVDLSTRIELTLELLKPSAERGWGRVSELAQHYGLSRTTLYALRARGQQALAEALAPGTPGPQPQSRLLAVDEALIQRAITVLPLANGSLRGIQQTLALLLGVSRSVGYISQTLAAVGAQAAAYNATLTVPQPVLGEADEIFQGQQPCLTVVDGRSFLVLSLAPAEQRDGTTWGVTFLDLEAQGIQFQDLTSDGAKGIQAGAAAAGLAGRLCPDLFHLLQPGQRVAHSLELVAYRALERAEQARQATLEAQAPTRRRGRRRPLRVSLAEAEAQAAQVLNTYELYSWLLSEIRQALAPLQPSGRLTTVAEAQATLETAIALLLELDHSQIEPFAVQLRKHLPDLLASLTWLEQRLAPYRQDVSLADEALIGWAWQHRQALALTPGEGFPAEWQPRVQAYWTALEGFHRASSLAESLHSWLRPYLAVHRGMPAWLLPLLQLAWNHHVFSRGKRAGSSPVELAGVSQAASLAQVLEQLLATLAPAVPEVEPVYTFGQVFGLPVATQPALQPA